MQGGHRLALDSHHASLRGSSYPRSEGGLTAAARFTLHQGSAGRFIWSGEILTTYGHPKRPWCCSSALGPLPFHMLPRSKKRHSPQTARASRCTHRPSFGWASTVGTPAPLQNQAE